MAAPETRILWIGSAREAESVVETCAREVHPRWGRLSVARVPDLEAGLERLHAERYDLIALDGCLDPPSSDPLIATQEVSHGAPIIVIVPSDRELAARRAVQRGARDYVLEEDLNPETLRRIVQHNVEKATAERRIADGLVALRSTEQQLVELMERNADGVLILYKNGLVRFANAAAESIFGRASSEIVGRPLGQPIAGKSTEEIDIIHRFGRAIAAEMRITETTWQGEKAVLATFRDVSKVRKLELDLEAARTAAGEITTVIRSSTRAIREVTERMARGGADRVDDPVEELRTIREHGIEILQAVDDALDHAVRFATTLDDDASADDDEPPDDED